MAAKCVLYTKLENTVAVASRAAGGAIWEAVRPPAAAPILLTCSPTLQASISTITEQNDPRMMHVVAESGRGRRLAEDHAYVQIPRDNGGNGSASPAAAHRFGCLALASAGPLFAPKRFASLGTRNRTGGEEGEHLPPLSPSLYYTFNVPETSLKRIQNALQALPMYSLFPRVYNETIKPNSTAFESLQHPQTHSVTEPQVFFSPRSLTNIETTMIRSKDATKDSKASFFTPKRLSLPRRHRKPATLAIKPRVCASTIIYRPHRSP